MNIQTHQQHTRKPNPKAQPDRYPVNPAHLVHPVKKSGGWHEEKVIIPSQRHRRARPASHQMELILRIDLR
jgi:hypothetical protein